MSNREEQLVFRGKVNTDTPKPKAKGVRSTSKEAYKAIKDKLGYNQQVVYNLIKGAKRAVNDQEISKELGWAINSVTGRRRELYDMNLIEEAFKATYPPTGRTVIYWQVKEQTK